MYSETFVQNRENDIGKAIINNLISHTKLISSVKTIFYKESKIVKLTYINNGFSNYMINKSNVKFIMLVNKINTATLQPIKKYFLPQPNAHQL